MVSIKWCLKTKNGLELLEPNKNMSESYIHMAEESIRVLAQIKKSKIWTATTTYYIFYYSLYSVMLRVGVKCEIHACSIQFMKELLQELYTNKDIEMIEQAFSARVDLQYYADRPVDEKVIEETSKYCRDFFIKTKNILVRINENQINKIRENLHKCL